MPTVPCRLCKRDKFFTRKKKRICPTNSWVCNFWTHKNSFDVCRQNVFRASVSSFVADVEVSRRLDRRNGKMQFCRLCKACKNNFCSSGFCQTDGVKCCLGVVLVLYLGKQFATKKPLPIPVCKRANYSAKSQKQTSGKYFFQCKKRQTADFFFLLLRFSFCKNIKVKTIMIFLKMRL